jgi:hypothetical protein
MNEEVNVAELSFWQQHKFFLLVGITIIVAISLVTVSLMIYNMSGAAQLDLSRPGYKAVASQAQTDQSAFANYAATGPVNSKTIEEFQKLYDAQAKAVTSVDAFGGDPLNANTLEFGTTENN